MTSTLAVRKTVALAGNPNTGKTSLFNRLTGLNQKVGNYPGITVECVQGETRLPGGSTVQLADVPGTYSLSARSEEEQIAIRAIAGLHPSVLPDAVVVVADATQLARNLYLVLQVLETDIPCVVALNMIDVQRELGDEVDVAALERELGVPVVPCSARTGEGVQGVQAALERVLEDPHVGRTGLRWRPEGGELAEDTAIVAAEIPEAWHHGGTQRRDALAIWALLSLDEGDELADVPDALRLAVRARREIAADAGRSLEDEIIQGRYTWIDERMGGFLRTSDAPRNPRTDRLDRILLHPALGFTIFLGLMFVVFQSLFTWSDPAIGFVEGVIEGLQGYFGELLPASFLTDLFIEGILGGVGGVIVFLPQILLLFLFIGVMEDSGYMARVAFLMDRIMKSVGLHGRAFVPMLSGFACAIPAIMATRTMERRRDRMLTMMVVPFMTCAARLPVYTLLIAALYSPDGRFFGLPVQGLLMVAMYLFSTVVALLAAAVLGRTLFKGPHVPLILEMPPYRRPQLASVARLMWSRSKVFITEAGTVILACTIGMWLLLSFPKDAEAQAAFDAQRAPIEAAAESGELSAEDSEAQLALLDYESEEAHQRQSYAGRLGRLIEPTIEPLGFDWKIGVGLLGAFAAREVFVSTMGVVYGMGGDVDEEDTGLRERLRSEKHEDGSPVYTPLVGLSLMVFFALAAQCMSTLAVVKRETHTYRWPVFLFVYMTALAWLASFFTYQGGQALGLGG